MQEECSAGSLFYATQAQKYIENHAELLWFALELSVEYLTFLSDVPWLSVLD
jgi:hypothetical protein